MIDNKAQVKNTKDQDQDKSQNKENKDINKDKEEEIVKIDSVDQGKNLRIENKENTIVTVDRGKTNKSIINNINNIKIIRKNIKKTDLDPEIDNKNKIIENSIRFHLLNHSPMFLCIFLFIFIF